MNTLLLINSTYYFGFLLSLLIQNTDCENLFISSQERIIYLQNYIEKKPQIPQLNNIEIASVVLPEYVLYIEHRGILEIGYIKILESLNLEKFQTISFGPFQMDINFIFDTLINSHINGFNEYKPQSKKDIYENLDNYSLLDSQWKILSLFFRNNIHFLESEHGLENISNIYNSGQIVNKSKYFKKITCEKKSYYQWCLTFKSQFVND